MAFSSALLYPIEVHLVQLPQQESYHRSVSIWRGGHTRKANCMRASMLKLYGTSAGQGSMLSLTAHVCSSGVLLDPSPAPGCSGVKQRPRAPATSCSSCGSYESLPQKQGSWHLSPWPAHIQPYVFLCGLCGDTLEDVMEMPVDSKCSSSSTGGICLAVKISKFFRGCCCQQTWGWCAWVRRPLAPQLWSSFFREAHLASALPPLEGMWRHSYKGELFTFPHNVFYPHLLLVQGFFCMSAAYF